MDTMLVILALYVIVLYVFSKMGGIGAAGEAFRWWGRAKTEIRPKLGSSS